MKKTDFLLFLLILLMILSGTLAYLGSTEDVASVVPDKKIGRASCRERV